MATGLGGAAQLTPAVVAANLGTLQEMKADLNSQLSPQLTAAGLDSTSFDPVSQPFRANQEGYDEVLENVSVVKTSTGATSVVAKFTLGGNVLGLGGQAGLALVTARRRWACLPTRAASRSRRH